MSQLCLLLPGSSAGGFLELVEIMRLDMNKGPEMLWSPARVGSQVHWRFSMPHGKVCCLVGQCNQAVAAEAELQCPYLSGHHGEHGLAI